MSRSPFDGIRLSRTQVPWHAAVLILPDLLTAAMILCKAVSLIIDTIGPDRVSHNVLRSGVRTLVFDDAHMVMSAALLGKGGLAIAFS